MFGLAAGLSGLWVLALPVSAAATPITVGFTTQGCTTWTVPTGVSSVQIQATGAAGFGGGSNGSTAGGNGGIGDGVSGNLSGLAGGSQMLDVCVDQDGGAGGAGAAPGGDGGGASGVSLGSDFSSPVLVAGGGGGGAGANGPGTAGPGGAQGRRRPRLARRAWAAVRSLAGAVAATTPR